MVLRPYISQSQDRSWTGPYIYFLVFYTRNNKNTFWWFGSEPNMHFRIGNSDRKVFFYFLYIIYKKPKIIYKDRSGPVLRLRTKDREDRSQDRSRTGLFQDRSIPNL